jgi:hypothetical protein
MVVVGLLVIREGVQDFMVEELDVSEVSRSAKWVKLPRPERDLTIGFEVEGQIFAQIRRQYEPMSDLVAPLSSRTRHRRCRHAAGVEEQPPPDRLAFNHGIGWFISQS